MCLAHNTANIRVTSLVSYGDFFVMFLASKSLNSKMRRIETSFSSSFVIWRQQQPRSLIVQRPHTSNQKSSPITLVIRKLGHALSPINARDCGVTWQVTRHFHQSGATASIVPSFLGLQTWALRFHLRSQCISADSWAHLAYTCREASGLLQLAHVYFAAINIVGIRRQHTSFTFDFLWGIWRPLREQKKDTHTRSVLLTDEGEYFCQTL